MLICIASLRAQQDYVQRELTLAISHIIDTFCIAAYRFSKPNLVHHFLEELRSWVLWPLDFRRAKLDGILAKLRRVKVPIIRADEDSPFKATTYIRQTRSESASWVNPARGGWNTASEPQEHWGPIQEDRSLAQPDPLLGLEIPDQRHFEKLAARAEKLCVGVCLECLKGKDVCRVAHVKAWHTIEPDKASWICGDCGGHAHGGLEDEIPCPGSILPPGWEALW